MPLLYFASDENSGVAQPAHTNCPRRFSLFSGLQGGKQLWQQQLLVNSQLH